jgi:hypothetical protein
MMSTQPTTPSFRGSAKRRTRNPGPLVAARWPWIPNRASRVRNYGDMASQQSSKGGA